MRLNGLAAFAGGAFAALLATVIGWQITQARSYEDCMVQEMRGQIASMHFIAHKLCARRFNLDFTINLPVNFDWAQTAEVMRMSVVPAHREYIVTQAYFRFSPRICQLSGSKDFGEEVQSDSRAGDVFDVALPKGSRAQCVIGRVTRARFR